MKLEWKLIGHCGVDSGQLLICDPCYIESEWKESGDNPVPRDIYVDKDGRKFTLSLSGAKKDGITIFGHYEVVLPSGKTPNQHVADKDWVKLPQPPPLREFSYRGCCSVTLSDTEGENGQLDFKMGHGGAGVVASTAYGDGHYPVYGLFEKGGSRCMAMIVVTDEVERLPALPQ
jgi:hypothetical protein